MTRCLISAVLASLCLVVSSQLVVAATVTQQYDFNGDLTDSLGGEPLVAVNTQTSEFSGGAWRWTADGQPGAGLILSAVLSDPQNYSVGFRFSYNDFSSDPDGYTKIMSFLGETDDNGLYFKTDGMSTKLEFYPYLEKPATEYKAGTVYDFVLTRTSVGEGTVRIYRVSEGVPTLVFEAADPSGAAVPRELGRAPKAADDGRLIEEGLYEFRLFMDDTDTNDEYTTGGSVFLVKVWGETLSESEVGTALDVDRAPSIPVAVMPYWLLGVLGGLLGLMGLRRVGA